MELSIYDVIKGTIATSKTLATQKKLGKITFEVNKLSNKVMIREAVEKIWDVKVRDVRIINAKGASRKVGRRLYKRPDTKKALITLRPGYTIDLPDQYETMGVEDKEVGANKVGANK